jgi:amidohydrolase
MTSPLALAKEIAPELIELRRDLHQHPETAFEELRTGDKVAAYCERLGLTVERQVALTGVIATLNPNAPAPALAFRADMDALPIQEEADVPFRSTTPGKAHVCGHDAHTTMLLGAAKILAAHKERLPFPVRFYFQPAEEVTGGGAEKMVEERRLKGVGAIYGLHVNPMLGTGCIGLRSGALMASMDKFEIVVSGAGGHGAMPHLTRDPVVAAAEIILALQTVVARRMDPLESAVVSVCQVEAGSAFNAIPSTARLVGTARSLSPAVRDNLPQWIEQIATGVAAAHHQTAKLQYVRGTPVLMNPPDEVARMAAAFRALGGKVVESKPTMGGEDFAYFLQDIPGCFGFLGAGDDPTAAQPFHSPFFKLDENALAWGTALFVQLAFDRAGSTGQQ